MNKTILEEVAEIKVLAENLEKLISEPIFPLKKEKTFEEIWGSKNDAVDSSDERGERDYGDPEGLPDKGD